MMFEELIGGIRPLLVKLKILLKNNTNYNIINC